MNVRSHRHGHAHIHAHTQTHTDTHTHTHTRTHTHTYNVDWSCMLHDIVPEPNSITEFSVTLFSVLYYFHWFLEWKHTLWFVDRIFWSHRNWFSRVPLIGIRDFYSSYTVYIIIYSILFYSDMIGLHRLSSLTRNYRYRNAHNHNIYIQCTIVKWKNIIYL